MKTKKVTKTVTNLYLVSVVLQVCVSHSKHITVIRA